MNTTTDQKKRGRRGWGMLFLTFLTLTGTIVIQAIGQIIAGVNMKDNLMLFAMTSQLIAAGSAALGMLLLGGIAWVRPARTDILTAFRTCWPILAADAAILVFACGSFVFDGGSVAPDWLSNFVLVAIMCLGIGISEEFLFRGIILNGILAVSGKSHRGTMLAVMITSVLFGWAHVDLSTDLGDPLLATQAVLKIIQTALFSIIMCSIVLRTRRLGGASLIHGLSNYLLMIPSVVLAGEGLSINYVSSGDAGVEAIITYVVVIAFYLPFAIKGLRQLHRERVTCRGAFMERRLQKLDGSAAAVLPSGMPNAA